jgi:hypothetical protein
LDPIAFRAARDPAAMSDGGYIRLSRQVELTEAGRLFLNEARDVIARRIAQL